MMDIFLDWKENLVCGPNTINLTYLKIEAHLFS
jgi:hypothetical protein